MAPQPSLFISHGAPTMVLEETPARRFLVELGCKLSRPRAILVASAHWLTPKPALGAAARPETIHDFYGFPKALYNMRYSASGAPDLAQAALDALTAAGVSASLDPTRGLDHGVWAPLTLMFPDADIPVIPLSIQPAAASTHHWRVGQALRPLRDQGVLIIGSGAVTHNLRAFGLYGQDDPPPDWVSAFADWAADCVAEGRADCLMDFHNQAPFSRENHPTDEHLLPLFVAMGAAGRGRRIHNSYSFGVLAMDVYAFDETL
ncbi:4,5-DOPA dioxygenase extradiol [Azospirillaceae bacterium]